jgi:hypothetical protein
MLKTHNKTQGKRLNEWKKWTSEQETTNFGGMCATNKTVSPFVASKKNTAEAELFGQQFSAFGQQFPVEGDEQTTKA